MAEAYTRAFRTGEAIHDLARDLERKRDDLHDLQERQSKNASAQAKLGFKLLAKVSGDSTREERPELLIRSTESQAEADHLEEQIRSLEDEISAIEVDLRARTAASPSR